MTADLPLAPAAVEKPEHDSHEFDQTLGASVAAAAVTGDAIDTGPELAEADPGETASPPGAEITEDDLPDSTHAEGEENPPPETEQAPDKSTPMVAMALTSEPAIEAVSDTAAAEDLEAQPPSRRSRFSWRQAAAVVAAVTIIGGLVAAVVHQTTGSARPSKNATPSVDGSLALANLTRGLVTPGRITATTAPVSVNWNPVTDAHGYQVQITGSSGEASAGHTLSVSQADTTVPVTFGQTYDIRVRARGSNGAFGPWTSLPPLTAVFVPAASSKIRYSGQWKKTSTGMATSAANGAATLSFNGQNIAWVAATGANYGRAAITFDGAGRKSADLYAPQAATLQAVTKKGWFPSPTAAHVIRVQNDGRGSINVTGFVVLR